MKHWCVSTELTTICINKQIYKQILAIIGGNYSKAANCDDSSEDEIILEQADIMPKPLERLRKERVCSPTNLLKLKVPIERCNCSFS